MENNNGNPANGNPANGSGGHKKYYKKRNYHNKNKKHPKQEKLPAADVINEAPENPAKPSETQPENKQSNKNFHKKNNKQRKHPENKSHADLKNDSDFSESGSNLQNTSFLSNSDDEVSETCMLDAIDTIDELEEKDALSDLLLLEGTDGVDFVGEENEEEGKKSEDEEKYEVIGVRFGPASKTYYFDPAGFKIENGCGVIVETVRGDKYGICNMANAYVPAKNVFLPLKKVLRIASQDDKIINDENIELAQDAFRKCNRKIAEHGLDMKLIEATYTHDRSKLIFFFTAHTRVDFRELVKDLAFMFKTRIDLRQIGIRDEAKMIGGYGICGRPLCCCSFLPNFNQVSIKMAKEQNLSLNTSKISGVCGRLMCCLKFEHKTYLDEAKLMPPVGSFVKTADGNGEVTEVNPIGGTVKVKFKNEQDIVTKSYPQKEVSVIKRADKLPEWQSEEEDSSN